MNKRVEKLLKTSKPTKSVEEREKLFEKINKLLDGKSAGIMFLSEIEKTGRDKITTIAFNCDEEHSNLTIAFLISKLPGIKKSLDKLLEKENNLIVNRMVS